MIQAFHDEPQGPRQRFEPSEQQRAERRMQDRHIHLHLHLNLTLRASQKRSMTISCFRVIDVPVQETLRFAMHPLEA